MSNLEMGASQTCCLLLLLLFLTQADGQGVCIDPRLACVERNNCNAPGVLSFRLCPLPGQVCCIDLFVISTTTPTTPTTPTTTTTTTTTTTPTPISCTLPGATCVSPISCLGAFLDRQCPTGQVCCIDSLIIQSTTLPPCNSFNGITCVAPNFCNGPPIGFGCPTGEVCCIGSLTVPTSTMPPCTFPGLTCVFDGLCPFGNLPSLSCPFGQVCCVGALTVTTTTTTTLRPCLGANSCITSDRCPSTAVVSARQCPPNEVCCPTSATLAPTTLSPCTGTGLGCVATCSTFVLPRACPGGLMCCAATSG